MIQDLWRDLVAKRTRECKVFECRLAYFLSINLLLVEIVIKPKKTSFSTLYLYALGTVLVLFVANLSKL